MGKVIILAGAPDATSLDWSELEDSSKAESVWQHGEDTSHDETTEWRSVPLRRAQDIQAEPSIELPLEPCAVSTPPPIERQDGMVDLGESVQVQVQREWAETTDFDSTNVVSFNNRDSQSQQPDWSVSSADIPSLSVRIPGALPPPPPPDFRDLETPTNQASTPSSMFSGQTTASQELIEHSLAVHDALPSSLPVPSDFSRAPETVKDRTENQKEQPGQSRQQQYMPSLDSALTGSFEDTAPSVDLGDSFPTSLSRVPPRLPAGIPQWQPLTHLVDIPSADVVTGLAGRTVTVNIVAAVVAASAPRDVNVRQNANNSSRRPTLSLVELVLGDDTKSGFGITIWLDPSVQGPQPGGFAPRPPSLATVLPTLQPQDVVLVQNLSLNVYNGKVYGSTLRRNMTQMHVLFRQRHSSDSNTGLFSGTHIAAAHALMATGQLGIAPDWRLAAKAARVRSWALLYVFAGNRTSGQVRTGTTAAGNIWVQPPVDTQDTQDT